MNGTGQHKVNEIGVKLVGHNGSTSYFPKTTCALKKKKNGAHKYIQEHTEKCSTVVSRKHLITMEICVWM